MADNIEQTILDEIRSLRKHVSKRLDKVEEDVSSLQMTRSRVKGFLTAIISIPAISTAIGFFIKHHVDK